LISDILKLDLSKFNVTKESKGQSPVAKTHQTVKTVSTFKGKRDGSQSIPTEEVKLEV